MRVLHLLDVPWFSGLAHYAVALAEGQARAGHEVELWAPSASPAYAEAARRGLRVRPLDRPLRRLRSLRAETRRRGFEVLDAHTGRTHTLAVVLAAGTAAAVVRTLADARPVRARPGSRWLHARTRAVIAGSRSLLADMEAALPLPPLRAAVHQGLEADGPFAPSPVPGEPVVGMVARLDPVKGHDCFLRAAAQALKELPDLRFELAGAEANLALDGLRARAKGLGLDGKARFLGRVEDVPAFMRRCRVGVVASVGSEAVSRAGLEWLASGRPLVAARVGALPELVEDGRCGRLVPPSDPEALADAMVEAVRRAEAWGPSARRRFEEAFTLERFVRETDAVYRAALPRESPA